MLRPQTDGEAEVSVDGGTVGEALRELAERYPQTKDQLFSPEGDLNRYVNVYLNDEDVRVLDGLDTGASDSDTVVILPAMAGGGPHSRVSQPRSAVRAVEYAPRPSRGRSGEQPGPVEPDAAGNVAPRVPRGHRRSAADAAGSPPAGQ